VLDSKARAALEGIALGAGRALGRMGFTPNTITALGVVLTAVAAGFVVRGAFLVAGAVLIAGGILDFFDGGVARATGKVTQLGGFLDSVSDRISDLVILSALCWAMFAAGDEVPAALALASLGAAQLTSYIRAKAESLGYSCKVGIMERAERMIVLIIGLTLGVVEIALGVLAVGSILTVVQRLVHVGSQAHADR
jgi:CDP-diacylglycerol--glycerol-3-phosphate 3-phosphatidyltransferase